jgi:hypothetical protein
VHRRKRWSPSTRVHLLAFSKELTENRGENPSISPVLEGYYGEKESSKAAW